MDKQNNLFEKVDEISQNIKEIKNINNDKLTHDKEYYIDFINNSHIEMIWQDGSKKELERKKKKYKMSKVFLYIIPLALAIWCCFYSLYSLITIVGIFISLMYETYRIFYIMKFERVMTYVNYKNNKLIKIEFDDFGLPENIKVKHLYIDTIVLIGSCIANTVILLFYAESLYFLIAIFSILFLNIANIANLNFITYYRAVFVKDNERYGSWQLYDLIKEYEIQINK